MHGRINDATMFELHAAVPNQPVCHEVDAARHRQFRTWLLVGLVLVAAALFNGSQRLTPVLTGYRLEELARERAREEAITRQLRLEIAALEAPGRIEDLAMRELHLVAPSRQDAVVIERVVPPAEPPSSVVAER
jgi:cell division protein FtsL